ncbi:MAG: hypothetical protein IIA54_00515 [Chloroflexi bacterium]|nr:hypothetical protein [Chloroflexota bacterium]
MSEDRVMRVTYGQIDEALGVIGGIKGLLAMAPALGFELPGEARDYAVKLMETGRPIDIVIRIEKDEPWTLEVRAGSSK